MLRALAEFSQASRSRRWAALRHLLVVVPCREARLRGGCCVTPPVVTAESLRDSLSFPTDDGKTV